MEKPDARLYVDAPLGAGASVTLDGPQAHYLGTVLRLKPGAILSLFNGRDGDWFAQLEQAGRGGGTALCTSLRREQPAGEGPWLLFAPLKRARIDLVAEKGSELGASVLWPVMTRYADVSRVNLDRLAAHAREAAEQCERMDLPELRAPASLESVLDGWPTDRLLLVCAEAGEAEPPASLFPPLAGRKVAFLVGPEGGFSAGELERLRAHPCVRAVGLGPRLLRAETASIFALSCWQALAGDSISSAARPPFA